MKRQTYTLYLSRKRKCTRAFNERSIFTIVDWENDGVFKSIQLFQRSQKVHKPTWISVLICKNVINGLLAPKPNKVGQNKYFPNFWYGARAITVHKIDRIGKQSTENKEKELYPYKYLIGRD